MQITKETLEQNKQALLQQQEQGLFLYHQTTGALQLIEALQAQLADAVTEGQLGHMLDGLA